MTSIESIGEGRNSQVYRLTCGSSRQYTGKVYFRHGLDDRDRLGAEFSGLQLLWENGVGCIPRPIVADRERGCAVYEYVEGKKISSSEVTNADIDYAVEFLARLKQLTNRTGSRNLPSASEACFSVQAIVNNIGRRLDRLSALRKDKTQYRALHEFLRKDFVPSFNKVTKWCQLNLNQSGMSFDAELPYEERTLSPSDFGFHNALRRGDGQIVFLDFEYFGWDDPAKMISDFLLHPAMELREELKRRFVSSILSRFQDYRNLDRRVEIVYPWFGLKWCLIFLNEFVPEHQLRRRFASQSELDISNLQAEQLSKAKRMVYRVMNEYKQFPYHE